MTAPKGLYRRRRDAKLDIAKVRAAHRLYQEGLSVRKVADLIWERFEFASAASCAQALHDAFTAEALPLRNRIDATVAASWKHGKARRRSRDREHVRAQRVARGEIRDRRCAATTSSGRPCARFALADRDHCIAHEPERRAWNLENLERARARQHQHG